MKNIQIIDGATNCTYSLFAASEKDFRAIFPRGTDIAFPDEVSARLRANTARSVFERLWRRPVDKKTATGIHGTMFYGLDEKKSLYPSRREASMDPRSFNVAQRKLMGI